MPSFLRPSLFLLLACVLSLGCKKIPAGRDAVVGMSLSGTPRRLHGDLAKGLATKKTDRFLGLFLGVYEWKTFDETALEADIVRIERELRRAGYYEAHVVATRVIRIAEDKVKVEVDLFPGPRITVSRIKLEGVSSLPFDAAIQATRALSLSQGDPFDETQYEQAKLDVAGALADVGYAHVKVTGHAKVQLATRSADVTVTVNSGPRAVLGEVRIEGLVKIPESIVRQTLQLRAGDQYSRQALTDARAALFRLGVFSRVDIVPALGSTDADVVPLTVQLEEGALKSISASAGANLDVLRLSIRSKVAWSHRNFLGGLRKFTISTQPGLTFFPTRIDYLTSPTNVLPENALTATLEQPSFIGGRTTGVFSTGYNVYPLLYPLPGDVGEIDPRTENVVGYNELALRAGLEHPYLSGRLPVSLSMNWRANFPFAYQGVLVDGLDEVIVAYPEFDFVYDLRDDPIAPTTGLLLQNNFQVALPTLGSNIFDVRIRPEIRSYIPLDFKKRLVLAARYTMGFLFTNDYGAALTQAGTGTLDYTDPAVIRDQHTLLFRAFYSGGPTSNRGYPYQQIGPQGTIGFLIPSGTDCQMQDSNGNPPAGCQRPLGGFNLWEASVELRYRLPGPWGVVGFADASDVGLQDQFFDFSEPHLSVGAGLRYSSPIGPVRFDVGYRVPGMQKLNDTPNDPPDISEVSPYKDQHGGGIAIHVLIGEAF